MCACVFTMSSFASALYVSELIRTLCKDKTLLKCVPLVTKSIYHSHFITKIEFASKKYKFTFFGLKLERHNPIIFKNGLFRSISVMRVQAKQVIQPQFLLANDFPLTAFF